VNFLRKPNITIQACCQFQEPVADVISAPTSGSISSGTVVSNLVRTSIPLQSSLQWLPA
jgi:hypothetical protein